MSPDVPVGSAADDAADPDVPTEPRRLLERSAREVGLTIEHLWLRYFALGGQVEVLELEAYLAGLMPLPATQYDVLAQAVNERLEEVLGEQRVPYSFALGARPGARPLAGLIELLRASHRSPPDRLGALAADAARALGVRAVMYLIDHDRQRLHPVPDDDGSERASLRVDTTAAGQAFRQLTTVSSTSDGAPRWLVPLVDGMHRLGVLDVRLSDPVELGDPFLQEQCEALATTLAHLVLTSSDSGDGLDAIRRQHPRTPAAELVWQLLPSPAAGTDDVTVAGWLLSTGHAGGDAFDYDLSATHVRLAIFDAEGHGLPAALAAATALSAYRSARRNGDGLAAQVAAVDDAVATQFPDGVLVTGILAELDLTTGVLAHLNAGHPPALVLREGQVVQTLDASVRPAFGLPAPALSARSPLLSPIGAAPVEQQLQRGDWIALHTDGVTAARDPSGAEFGHRRLTDLLERAAAGAQPPDETVRRLCQDVLAHQHGVLQDDATIVLAAWTSAWVL